MCGINAVLKYTRIEDSDCVLVQKMNSSMVYRGPDDQGFWNDEKVALGMRRLSIVGLENGHQPFFSEGKRIVLVCNGEIYNYPVLRNQLEKKGHVFETSSDCESIIHLYEEYGQECVTFLRGMFAFVLWDSSKCKLFAARDRLGEKPLYYSELPTGVVFSSELKTINEYWLKSSEPDWGVIAQTLEYGFAVDEKRTIVKGIKRVAPGECVLIDDNGPKLRKYWKPVYNPTFRGSYSEAIEGLKAHVEETVLLRLQSDVPVGVLLSSGIDSSLIASIISKKSGNVTAITAGYRGKHDCDERVDAKRFADDLQLPWSDIELSSDDFEQYFDEFLDILDEPIGDIASFAQWGIYKNAAQKGYKVLLSGVGGDELFFGYPYHNKIGLREEKRRKLGKYLPLRGKRSVLKFMRGLAVNPKVLYDMLEYVAHDSSFDIDKRWSKEMSFAEELKGHIGQMPRPHQLFEKVTRNGYDQVYAGLIGSWLWSNCLSLADKLGMGASVEVRCPFVDHVLLEYVYSLPLEWRLSLSMPKKLIREAYKDNLPKWVLSNKKKGFAPPLKFVSDLVECERKNRPNCTINSYTGLITSRIYGKFFNA